MKPRAGSTLVPLLALLALPAVGRAKLCGDAVGGQDVACACGDVVASDVVLSDADPVTQGPCAGDGLIVRATGASAPITVDLNGKTLRGGSRGTGLWVLYGGPGGAKIVSSGGAATIDGFFDGVVAHADDAIGLLDGVVATHSGRDGFRIEGNGYEVRNAVARHSGRDGFAVTGKNFRVNTSRAEAVKRYGFYVFGDAALLAGLTADGCGWGFGYWGMDDWLAASTATNAVHDGFYLWGMRHTITGCTASGNGESGLTGMAMGSTFAGNQASGNGADGIAVNGPGVLDGGGNQGSGNRGEKLHRAVIQCAFNGVECRP